MAATITYKYPVTGTTPPTAAQAARVNSLSATVYFDGGADTAVITHNWGLTATELAYGWPWVTVNYNQLTLITSNLSVIASDSVSVTVFRTETAVWDDGTWSVVLQRPHSMVT